MNDAQKYEWFIEKWMMHRNMNDTQKMNDEQN